MLFNALGPHFSGGRYTEDNPLLGHSGYQVALGYEQPTFKKRVWILNKLAFMLFSPLDASLLVVQGKLVSPLDNFDFLSPVVP